jgi:alanine dehydrogenase
MSGVDETAGVMGAKLIAANLRQRCASYLIPLFDLPTVELLALIDGNGITGYRTAATTALAIDALTTSGPLHVGVLGTGFEARNHVRALASVRDIASVAAFSPNPASRQAFADAMADTGLAISMRETSQEVVAAAPDVLICAARSKGEVPLFDGAWLSPGMMVASIGSTVPEQREIDVETIARASLIVADMVDEVMHETGDMLLAEKAGVRFATKIRPLSSVIGSAAPVRITGDEIVLYKSAGSALQDLTVAAMCYARAVELGLGSYLENTIRPVNK